MYVRHLDASGFGAFGSLELDFERAARFEGMPRALCGLGDALTLAFAAWDRAVLEALLLRWGCVGVAIEGDGIPQAATWSGAPGIEAVLDPSANGLLSVEVVISLDPPQFGRLRKEAVRDPRLVDALATGSDLRLRVGVRFAAGLDALALDHLGFSIGEVSFPVSGSDRPIWLPGFLAGLAGRFQRGGVAPSRWAERAASYRIADLRAVDAALAALAAPPATLGECRVMPAGPAVVLPDAVVPLQLLGERGQRAAALVGAVYLSGAEVLVLDEPPPDWVDWLVAQAEGESTPLEQVILLGARDGRPIG